MKKLTDFDKELIREEVQDTLGYVIDNFFDAIDHSSLTPSQKLWARKNLDWKVVIL
jgi:hypothetical protein